MNLFSTAATFYKDGGMFMHAVLVIAIVIVAIVVERSIVLHRAAGGGRRFVDDLVQRAARGDTNGARQLAMNASTPQARVAQAMLAAGGGDGEKLQAAGDDAATLILPELTRRLSYLGMLANSATLIGLLGTITGLITAIAGVGVADAAQRSAYLTAGIAEALHTTAFGLMVAIPTLVIQSWLNGRVESIIGGVDELCIRMSQALTASWESSHARAAAAPHLAPVQPLRPQAAVHATPRVATGTQGAGR